MQSFRTEIENPIVEKDIIELERKIFEYRNGDLPEEKFRSLRLARGVYGQRQQGVQMVRIKLPFGKISPAQLRRIAGVSDKYSNGNLHLTTRQDIQIHFVSLDSTPEVWAELDKDEITIREACGNTVRNITASHLAGIDPLEPFDVSPYADEVFRYFLRNPVCQEMGRKFKIAFASSEEDTAFTFIHDLGFIPKVRINDGKIERGFRVVIGGGLGAQPVAALPAKEFLHEVLLIPFIEATIRVFDRHGERTSRHKARLKYLIAKTGVNGFLKLVDAEWTAITHKEYQITGTREIIPDEHERKVFTTFKVSDNENFKRWKETNVFEQKQKGWFAVQIRVPLGNFNSDTARSFAEIAETYASDDLRITINQGLLLKFVRPEALPALYSALERTGFAQAGADSTADITACPGTDTCNLGIASSTGISKEFEKVIGEEFPDLVYDHDIKIKISGCMNSCGQHGLAQIGFHGSSFKNGNHVVPALQVLLGGGKTGNGEGRISEKIIKIPSKRGPQVLRKLLKDYETNETGERNFNSYYDRKGKEYFYQLLKPLAETSNLVEDDYIDWGQEEKFRTMIGVGECAGVMIDLVATLLTDSEEKILNASESLEKGRFGDSVYFSYSAFVNTAKALLLRENFLCNTQQGIISDFDKYFQSDLFHSGFKNEVLEISKNEPEEIFATRYLRSAKDFLAASQSGKISIRKLAVK